MLLVLKQILVKLNYYTFTSDMLNSSDSHYEVHAAISVSLQCFE
jgi:hypothetical protein